MSYCPLADLRAGLPTGDSAVAASGDNAVGEEVSSDFLQQVGKRQTETHLEQWVVVGDHVENAEP